MTLKKDAWLAVNLSMFFPGIGQIYAEKIVKGVSFLVIYLILVIFTFWSIFAAEGNTFTGLIFVVIIIGLYLFNLFDAFHCLHDYNATEKIPRKIKNPWFAVFLSRVLPGLGQLYLEKFPSAVIFISLIITFGFLDDLITKLLIVSPIITALATYHVYIIFHRRKQALISLITGLVLLAGMMINYFPYWVGKNFIPFEIPSQSMQPTLEIGDRIFVIPFDQPERGDLVVFKATETAKALDPDPEGQKAQFYVKRVIGKPGETVLIDQGLVYINDQPLVEKYLAEQPNYQWEKEIVPPNSYFVLGDNRNDSFDSHIWGFVPRQNLIGKAYKIYWPPSRISPINH